MDRRLLGFFVVLVLLVLCNTVLADHGGFESRRFQSDADAYRRHHYARRHHRSWQSVADFRTRRHHTSNPVVGIDRRVSAIWLEGLKRTAYVYRAFVETRRGRLIQVPELEGRLLTGDSKTVRLRRARYVRNLVLKVDSPRHKRAYVRVSVRPPAGDTHALTRYRRSY